MPEYLPFRISTRFPNVGQQYDKTNYLLMHAMAPNVAGGDWLSCGCWCFSQYLGWLKKSNYSEYK